MVALATHAAVAAVTVSRIIRTMLPAVLKIGFVAIAPTLVFFGGCHYRLDQGQSLDVSEVYTLGYEAERRQRGVGNSTLVARAFW